VAFCTIKSIVEKSERVKGNSMGVKIISRGAGFFHLSTFKVFEKIDVKKASGMIKFFLEAV